MHKKVSLSSPFRVVYMYMCFGTTHWDWSILIITHHLHQATVAAFPESTSLVFHLRKVNKRLPHPTGFCEHLGHSRILYGTRGDALASLKLKHFPGLSPPVGGNVMLLITTPTDSKFITPAHQSTPNFCSLEVGGQSRINI